MTERHEQKSRPADRTAESKFEQAGNYTSAAQAASTRNLASYKFEVLETVDNDPALGSGGGCLSVMRVGLSFMNSWDASVYLPIRVLMKRTGLGSGACVKARQALVASGYFVRSGQNARGLDTFHIKNPRRQIVSALMEDRAERLDRQDRERKDRQRKKRSVISESEITKHDDGAAVISETEITVMPESEITVISIFDNKYVEGNTGDETMEGGSAFQADTAVLSSIETDVVAGATEIEDAPSVAPDGASGASEPHVGWEYDFEANCVSDTAYSVPPEIVAEPDHPIASDFYVTELPVFPDSDIIRVPADRLIEDFLADLIGEIVLPPGMPGRLRQLLEDDCLTKKKLRQILALGEIAHAQAR